jgi:AcrR family transcriptional regulator
MDERALILRAATAEFAEFGMQESSLDRVARRAGVGVEAVRALFVDEATLLRELLKEEGEPLVSGIALAIEDMDDVRVMIRKTLELYDRWLLDHEQIVRIMMRCALDDPKTLRVFYEQSLLPSEFFEHLERGIGTGRLRCRDMLLLNVLIESLILYPHIMRPMIERLQLEDGTEEFMERKFEAVVDLLENGLYSTP